MRRRRSCRGETESGMSQANEVVEGQRSPPGIEGGSAQSLRPTRHEREGFKPPWGNLGYHFDVIFELTKKEIKVRYKNNFLGYLWSLLNPLAQAFTFYVAFKVVFHAEIPGYSSYSLFLITGLFPWQW